MSGHDKKYQKEYNEDVREKLMMEIHSSDNYKISRSEIPYPNNQSLPMYIKAVREGQKIPNENGILLAVAWASKHSQLSFAKFPEVIFSDVTEGTNSEKRPFFIISGKNANNNIIPFMKAFLPSQQQWVFQWLFEVAFPTLHKKEYIEKFKWLLLMAIQMNICLS